MEFVNTRLTTINEGETCSSGICWTRSHCRANQYLVPIVGG